MFRIKSSITILILIGVFFDDVPWIPGGVLKQLSLLFIFIDVLLNQKILLHKNFFVFLICTSIVTVLMNFTSLTWKSGYTLVCVSVLLMWYTSNGNMTKAMARSAINRALNFSYIFLIPLLLFYIFDYDTYKFLVKPNMVLVSKATARFAAFNSEPAFLAQASLMFFALVLRFELPRRHLFVLSALILFSGSFTGMFFLVVLCALSMGFTRVLFIIPIALSGIFISGIIDPYALKKLSYAFSGLDLKQIALSDDSVLLRVYNPIFALSAVLRALGMPMGIEMSWIIYPDSYLAFSKSLMNSQEIGPIIQGHVKTSPKNLMVKLLLESGFLLVLLRSDIARILGEFLKGNILVIVFFLLSLVMDSYYYVPFWLLIFLFNIEKKSWL